MAEPITHHNLDHLPHYTDGQTLTLPLLKLKDKCLLPEVTIEVKIGNQDSIKAIKYSLEHNCPLMIATQKDPNAIKSGLQGLYPVGSIGIVKRFTPSENKAYYTLEIMSIMRATLLGDFIVKDEGIERCNLQITCESDQDKLASESKEVRNLVLKIKHDLDSFANWKAIDPSLKEKIRSQTENHVFINYMAVYVVIDVNNQFKLQLANSYLKRGQDLIHYLEVESVLLSIENDITLRVQKQLTDEQRQHILRTQMNAIKAELGEDKGDVELLMQKAKSIDFPEKIATLFQKEVQHLMSIPQQQPDYSTQFQYLSLLTELPWKKSTTKFPTIKSCQRTLNTYNYGLKEAKQRILEHLAVSKLSEKPQPTILCFYGPPGVGKTSLAKSVADSIKRKYIHISLGGVHDEAEIRGHRRTYVAAMPGRIIKAMQGIEFNDPVVILDEIDKVSQGIKGDPQQALLELLDPAQNNAFHDNYLDLDYDLSNCFFIATANDLSTISQPLRDRMEIIPIPGYIVEEKVEIAYKHLVPKALKVCGLTDYNIMLSRPIIREIILNYTRESGVRKLNQQILKILRKIAMALDSKETFNEKITKEDLVKYLGSNTLSHDTYDIENYYGVVTGLAWTSVGGEILFIEAVLNDTKGGKLTLTGNLGKVMIESAKLAFEFLKAHHSDFDITQNCLENHSVHIHIPQGGIPKDGPSAGITILCALISVFTKRKPRKQFAMTGEISLRGKLLPVGGIREKILAAKQAGITEIMLCEENKKDLIDIPKQYLKGLTFTYMKDMKEAVFYALNFNN